MLSGKTGSGKSARAVHLIYKMWKKGKDVWSNTPLFFTDYNNGFGGENIKDDPKFFSLFERVKFKLSKKIIKRGSINYFDTIDEVFYIKNSVIFFDEGQTLFRNYDWESIPRLFLYKLEQNRKHGLDLVTTAQRMKAVNINYRELIQHWYYYKSLLPEWLEKFIKIHLFLEYKMDSDYVAEQYLDMNELIKPKKEYDLEKNKYKKIKSDAVKKVRIRFLAFWEKRKYDTMYDIGFEPLQHYTVRLGNEIVKLHLESGLAVQKAITTINSYKKLNTI